MMPILTLIISLISQLFLSYADACCLLRLLIDIFFGIRHSPMPRLFTLPPFCHASLRHYFRR